MQEIGLVHNRRKQIVVNVIWVVVSNIFYFQPYLGEDSHFDQYFSDGLKPPTRMLCFESVSFSSSEG